tara:strand:+ start:1564 stop:1737 length:174 start_codon:yes stop_codon:yes gene_type:complete
MNEKLLEILVCPLTRGKLILRNDELISREAKLAYPIREGIPILVVSEARSISDEDLN